MPVGAGLALVAGTSYLGSRSQSRAAGRAVDAQVAGDNAAIAESRRSENRALALSAPTRQAGYRAQAALMDMVGLSRGTRTPTRTPTTIDATRGADGIYSVQGQRVYDASGNQVYTGRPSNRVLDNASSDSERPVSDDEGGSGRPSFGGRIGAVARLVAGRALDAYEESPDTPQGGSNVNEFGDEVPNLADFDQYEYTSDPGYTFRLSEENRVWERGAAARGGLLSGGFARKAIRYSQDYASNEYDKIFRRIAAIAGYGMSATENAGQTIINTGNNVSRAFTNSGEARASGYIAQGNARSNLYNQLGQLGGYALGASGGGGGGGIFQFGAGGD